MGNRSSSHYLPPPPPWTHGPYPAYATPSGIYDGKRPLNGPPGAFAEPYVPHPNLRRSMISLNADSGYLTSPSDSERMRMRGSRLSLNHLDFERQQQLVFPPDLKTIKKLEKMEKKQQKLLKKMGSRPMPPLPPSTVFLQPRPRPMPPPPLYSRAMSFDDLHRAHLAAVDGRFREQCRNGTRFQIPIDRHSGRSSLSTTTPSGQAVHRGGSMTSSPVTSLSDSHTGDGWTSSPLRRDARDDLSPMSETSAPLRSITRTSDSSKTDSKPKSVEIKVQRTERVERREQYDNKDWLNNNDTYAMPTMQPAFGSRSSLATSQARGESSDIDFSWIREEEKKLKNERENAKRLPECYFGMDPPTLEDTPPSSRNRSERDEKENHRGIGNVRSTAAAFENELREKREQALKSRSSTHIEDNHMEYSARREMGPMARRLHRMQREAEVANRNYNEPIGNKQRWRSSMAF